MGIAGLLELAHYAIALGWRGIDRYQIVVVQVHAPGAHLGQQRNNVSGRNFRPGGIAKGIAPGITDGPEAEGKLVFCTGLVAVSTCHTVFSMAVGVSIQNGLHGGTLARERPRLVFP